jgi:hypothetical protein
MPEFLDRMRAVARECGYAVAVHGSQKRDLDLVAVPWTPEAASAHQLVARLCEELGLVERANEPRIRNPEPKPWGRLAWSLAGCPGHEYVDLSVAPRCGEPVPLIFWLPLAPNQPLGAADEPEGEGNVTVGQRIDNLLADLRYRFGRRSPEPPPCLTCKGRGVLYNGVGWQTCRDCDGSGAADEPEGV